MSKQATGEKGGSPEIAATGVKAWSAGSGNANISSFIDFRRYEMVFLLLWLLAGCSTGKLGKDTEYSDKYSESKFRKIVPGMLAGEVVQLIGNPLFVYTQRWSEVWTYGDPSAGWVKQRGRDGRVVLVHTNLSEQYSQLSFSRSGVVMDSQGFFLKVDSIGLSKSEVITKLGNPTSRELSEDCTVFRFSRPKDSAVIYELRNVEFDDKGRVISTVSALWND